MDLGVFEHVNPYPQTVSEVGFGNPAGGIFVASDHTTRPKPGFNRNWVQNLSRYAQLSVQQKMVVARPFRNTPLQRVANLRIQLKTLAEAFANKKADVIAVSSIKAAQDII